MGDTNLGVDLQYTTTTLIGETESSDSGVGLGGGIGHGKQWR
ncbi:hypothetical protein TIFTF001_036840 [Ficus carica]|uniref:Uncharacterized protein n=1 Tax=Ficus carica TaxID=3494 RepID=A0AA88E530_FICCA|nr:hypothetical protein TIFTF001_036840 [Ficus carica]